MNFNTIEIYVLTVPILKGLKLKTALCQQFTLSEACFQQKGTKKSETLSIFDDVIA